MGAANWQGAYNATEYLIQLGHKRIGFLTGWMDLGAAIDRLDPYTRTMEGLRSRIASLVEQRIEEESRARS